MCVAFVPLLTLCLIRCVKNRKSDSGKTLGRIWLTLSPAILTTRDTAGIIQPNVNVMFYSRPPTRQDPPSAILARALSPMILKDRLTTPIMPLNPAYKPSQQVKVTTSPATTSTGALNSENELTLPPGYIVNRETKYM
ncbi:uncharacterized protein [Parasteatoda tepidariorum]|uniref:uncharacterized protein n=1 Tax=Parasteatoda tepidariorum TaxID=114398 RepID=UPI001C725D98|nr:uncharacterized protein LOC107441784 [Parasteatoda tepidariorum]